MTILVNEELCKGCGICMDVCPDQAISLHNGVVSIDRAKCSLCQLCVGICPTGALQVAEAFSSATSEKPRAMEVFHPQETTRISPQQTGKSGAWLYLLGQSVLPRLADILARFVEQRLAPLQQENAVQENRVVVESLALGRRRRHRGGKMSGFHAGRR